MVFYSGEGGRGRDDWRDQQVEWNGRKRGQVRSPCRWMNCDIDPKDVSAELKEKREIKA